MSESVANLEEKFGPVVSVTDWGRWWQTGHEVHIEVDVPEGTKPKELRVDIQPMSIHVGYLDQTYFRVKVNFCHHFILNYCNSFISGRKLAG